MAGLPRITGQTDVIRVSDPLLGGFLWADILVFYLAEMPSVEDDIPDYLQSIAAIDNIWLTIRAEKEKAEQAKRDAEMNRTKARK